MKDTKTLWDSNIQYLSTLYPLPGPLMWTLDGAPLPPLLPPPWCCCCWGCPVKTLWPPAANARVGLLFKDQTLMELDGTPPPPPSASSPWLVVALLSTTYPPCCWCAATGVGWYTPLLEDARFTVYEDERETIATFVSVYGLQGQSNKGKLSSNEVSK